VAAYAGKAGLFTSMTIQYNCLKGHGILEKSPVQVFESGLKISLQMQPFICIRGYALDAVGEL
jgi:hypothetical protein